MALEFAPENLELLIAFINLVDSTVDSTGILIRNQLSSVSFIYFFSSLYKKRFILKVFKFGTIR